MRRTARLQFRQADSDYSGDYLLRRRVDFQNAARVRAALKHLRRNRGGWVGGMAAASAVVVSAERGGGALWRLRRRLWSGGLRKLVEFRTRLRYVESRLKSGPGHRIHLMLSGAGWAR